jgi:hypothetical protein
MHPIPFVRNLLFTKVLVDKKNSPPAKGLFTSYMVKV